MPDSLSKTVPIWCSVINRALFNDDSLYLPPGIVSPSEKHQISKKMPIFVEKLNSSSALDVPDISGKTMRSKIRKPLRPIWVTPDSFNPSDAESIHASLIQDFHPIICCTASIMAQDNSEHRRGYTYVQGAADDHEEWAIPELNPDMLWSNIDTFGNLDLDDEELLQSIKSIAETSKVNPSFGKFSLIPPSRYAVGSIHDKLSDTSFCTIINLSEDTELQLLPLPKNYLRIPIPKGKKGSKQLREHLPEILQSISGTQNTTEFSVLILCDTGADISVGVCLALLCLLPPPNIKKAGDKESIRQRLIWITSHRKVNPSRATLNSVNSFIMS